jgi:hypothetical protein
LRIGLGRSGVALLHRQGGWRRQRRVLAQTTWAAADDMSVDGVSAELNRLLSATACKRLPTRLVVADAWVRSWMVSPPGNACRLADCRAAAAARFQALYGEPPSAWQLAADWHARLPFLASALPQALVAALRRVCAEHQLVVLEIVPQFVAAWNLWAPVLQPGQWFGVLHGDTLNLGAVGASRLSALCSLTVPPHADADPGWLQSAVQREALRWTLPPPISVQLCGPLPVGWLAPGKAGWAGWTCTRLDTEFRPDPGAAAGGAPLQPAVGLAATGWR